MTLNPKSYQDAQGVVRKCRICGKTSPPFTLEKFRRDSKSKHGYRNECLECHVKYKVKRYRENPKIRETQARYRKENPEIFRENSRRWARENPGKHNKRNRKWCRNNPEKHLKSCRIAMKKWRKNHPEKVHEQNCRRRALRYNARGTFTIIEFWEVCENQGWQCAGCGCILNKSIATRDHILSLSRGGTDSIENIQAMCLKCNCSKGVRTMAEFNVVAR